MPAGKPNSKSTTPNLESFLIRKKISLQNWLSVNSITSKEALENFLEHSSWSLSHSIAEILQELIKKAGTDVPVILLPIEFAVEKADIPAISEPDHQSLAIQQHEVEPVTEATVAIQTISQLDTVDTVAATETATEENVVSEAEVVDTQTKPDTQESEEVITSSEETPSFNTAPNIVLNKERKKNRY
jgi:hypothetical protein